MYIGYFKDVTLAIDLFSAKSELTLKLKSDLLFC